MNSVDKLQPPDHGAVETRTIFSHTNHCAKNTADAMQRILFILTALLIISRVANAQNFKSDTLQTDQGPLAITFIGHA
ncbi:hypothetical protein DRI50_11225, partial [candidate division KSB1 bacterium]